MTQKVNPSEFRPAEAFKTAGAIALAGGSSDGWISSSSSPSDLSVQDTGVTESNLNAFSASTSSSSLDVTIDGGEAFIYGSWVVKDSTSTITLDASTSDQTVYVGWDKNGTDQVIVGLESAFETEADNTDEKVELYEFDTDSTGVTNSNDLREIGQYHKLSHAEIADQLDIPVYSELSNAPSNEGSIVVIDGSGSDVEGAYRYDGTSYDKIGNTNEEIEDIVNLLLRSGSNISLNYDDANDELTISLSNSPSVNSVTLSELMEMGSSTEPSTPSDDDVALWNSGNAVEAKFSDGSTVTLAQQ